MIREQPWNSRTPSTEHQRRFSALAELHSLSRAWVLERTGIRQAKGDEKRILEALDAGLCLEAFLDDTHPEDVLLRIEAAVWAEQSRVVRAAEGMDSAFGAISYNHGKAYAEKIWKNFLPPKEDLRVLALALKSTIFSEPSQENVVPIRLTSSEAELELMTCPHRLPHLCPKSLADRLCALHGEWIAGYISGIRHGIKITTEFKKPRCVQRWEMME